MMPTPCPSQKKVPLRDSIIAGNAARKRMMSRLDVLCQIFRRVGLGGIFILPSAGPYIAPPSLCYVPTNRKAATKLSLLHRGHEGIGSPRDWTANSHGRPFRQQQWRSPSKRASTASPSSRSQPGRTQPTRQQPPRSVAPEQICDEVVAPGTRRAAYRR